MSMLQIVLLVAAAVFLFLYMQRRKSRLNRED
jgi:hypothetical protein